MIDLRSDTVTKPTPAMLDAMFSAQVGDDVFGDDPTVHALETKAAQILGKEAALFCTSGTMTNQLALMGHLKPGDEVIAHKHSHIYLYEGGGLMANTGASIKLLEGDFGLLNEQDIAANLSNPHDIHQALTKLISLENTMNKGGGTYYSLEAVRGIKATVPHIPLHLDGARLFNATIAAGYTAADFSANFDTVSLCLSKGLGCPVGSILAGNKDFILQARRARKRIGGGWRQAGFLAAAGIFALEHHIERLKIDHENAQSLGEILQGESFVEELFPIHTNIVIFKLKSSITNDAFVAKAKEKGLLCTVFGPQLVRMVTHLDFETESLNQVQDLIKDLF